MLKFKKVAPDDLRAAIRNTAFKMSVNESIVEKDYWVCFVLNYLFTQCKWKRALTFKGGTSLSKCFGIIERFSEDVDLILDWRFLGYDINEPWEIRSNTKQIKFNKEVNRRTETFLKTEVLPQINKDFGESLEVDMYSLSIDEKDPQTILFHYPQVFTSEYLIPSVRLEVGALAAWSPSKDTKLSPYIYEYYPILFEGEFFYVKTVLPERTFWEKATILHHEANRPREKQMPDRYARHYYDLYCIGKTKYKDSALRDLANLKKVVEFKKKFYPRGWAKYEEATAQKIRLVPEVYRFREIERDYTSMREMFFGETPTFEELMAGIRALECEIHQLDNR